MSTSEPDASGAADHVFPRYFGQSIYSFRQLKTLDVFREAARIIVQWPARFAKVWWPRRSTALLSMRLCPTNHWRQSSLNARALARKRREPVEHSTLLEDQKVAAKDAKATKAAEARLDDIVRETNPPLFWD